jgi:hypothetical protein
VKLWKYLFENARRMLFSVSKTEIWRERMKPIWRFVLVQEKVLLFCGFLKP